MNSLISIDLMTYCTTLKARVGNTHHTELEIKHQTLSRFLGDSSKFQSLIKQYAATRIHPLLWSVFIDFWVQACLSSFSLFVFLSSAFETLPSTLETPIFTQSFRGFHKKANHPFPIFEPSLEQIISQMLFNEAFSMATSLLHFISISSHGFLNELTFLATKCHCFAPVVLISLP